MERWDDIQAAVRSVQEQSSAALETILVCDHNDELLRAARGIRGVVVLANSGSKGLSGARNTGVLAARGDVVAFLDDDAAAQPLWLENLLGAYSGPRVLGVGGLVLPAFQAPRPSWLPEEFLWVLGCSFTGQPAVTSDVRNAIGANMSFRREVFRAAGAFDTSMGRLGKDAAGCEETEFSIRARRVHPGATIVFEPSAVVRHSVPEERLTRRYFWRRCTAEGRSKALVTGLAGASSALETERTYVRQTLPQGVLRGLADASRGDTSGLDRAFMILTGFALTALAYLRARTSRSSA